MVSKVVKASKNVGNPLYTQDAMKKAVLAIMELSMVTMYKDIMNMVVKAYSRVCLHEYY